jgi:protein-tyrosine-phosphatase
MFASLGDPHRLAIAEELGRSDRTPAELANLVGLPSNLLAHHLNILEMAGLVERRRSEGDARRRYLVLRPFAVSIGRPSHRPRGSVLFVCSHNSARSQFAAALWQARTGQLAQSAGHAPASRIHALAIRAADDHGLDLRGATPKSFQHVTGKPELVVTVCDVANEGDIPFSAERKHWSIPDPVTDGRIGAFRSAFKEIQIRIDRLTEDM